MSDALKKLFGRSTLRIAGLMSGTSADGIDVAIVDVQRRKVRLLAHDTVPYPSAVRRNVFRLFDLATGRVDDVCHMNAVLGELFAEALTRVAKTAGVPLPSVDLVGSHGQTIHHLPRGRAFRGRRIRSTLQIGEPTVIAERTGITTVADFRPRDVAAGGEGAPLVPYADHFLFSHRTKTRAVQNIGGIANVTFLPASATLDRTVAFDTGPGNMLIDHAVSRITRGRKSFDAGGRIAARGRVDEKLLPELMRHPFLRRRPPKSTGREEFGPSFADGPIARARKRRVADADLVATLTAFTAHSIAESYRRFLPTLPDEVVLCGGGARNPVLVAMLRECLDPAAILPTDDLGIDADAKEAVSFAILAYATVRGINNNVPAATGADRPVVLGKIIPGAR